MATRVKQEPRMWPEHRSHRWTSHTSEYLVKHLSYEHFTSQRPSSLPWQEGHLSETQYKIRLFLRRTEKSSCLIIELHISYMILYDQRILSQHAWIRSQKPKQTIVSTNISQVREHPSAYRGRELIQLHSHPNGQEKVAAAEDSQQTTQKEKRKGWRHLPQSCAVF